MQKTSLFSLLILLLFSCENPNNGGQSSKNSLDKPKDFYKVAADGETTPVPHVGDAADDPVLYVNVTDPDNSIIYGSDKKGGIGSYRLNGKQILFQELGKINNIDIRYNFPINKTEKIDILAASNISDSTFRIYRINPNTSELTDISSRKFTTKLDKVYGLCLYQSPVSGNYFVFVNSKKGDVEQWELFHQPDTEDRIDARLVRTLTIHSSCEGMVADDSNAFLYVAEENSGIWKFLAEPEEASEQELIISIQENYLKADIEGLTIFYAKDDEGYLIASSQGNHSYAVFERKTPHTYLGSFVIDKSDNIQGTHFTDGIYVTGFSLGVKYPYGIFIAQDGGMKYKKGNTHQNFKLVDWKKIAETFDPPLIIDPKYNPYMLQEEAAAE
ncbi:MAG: phytase [Bacteroidales bacterium]